RMDVEHVLSLEASRNAETARSFYAYAKAWWAEYKGVHPSFKGRAVKLFANTERGEYVPVTSLVTPLPADRMFDSPYHAARFVSLLPCRR
ncbi:hypothetical protein OFC58_31510, partial [Escherichia coli]|nr:hypothetical protein [Escherichia coli]